MDIVRRKLLLVTVGTSRDNTRVATKISSCRVSTSSRWGIKQVAISFGFDFLLFSNESGWGPHS